MEVARGNECLRQSPLIPVRAATIKIHHIHGYLSIPPLLLWALFSEPSHLKITRLLMTMEPTHLAFLALLDSQIFC